MPVVWMVLTSLKSADQVFVSPPIWIFSPHWSNYPEVLTLVPFQRYILNTATIVGLVVLGTLLSCSFCAYGFARLRAPGRNTIFLLGFMIVVPSSVQQAEISRIERGIGNPTATTSSRLAAALGQKIVLVPTSS